MRALTLALGALSIPYMLHAQAIVVEPAPTQTLQTDPAADFFSRVRQLYDAAASGQDPAQAAALYRRSIPLLEDFITSYPAHKFAEPARYYLANAYFATGNRNLASNQLENLIRNYRTGPYVAASAFRLGYERYGQERYTRAARYFQITRSNAENESDRLRAAFFEAQCQLNLKDKLAAKPLLEMLAYSDIITEHTTQATQSLAHLHFSNQQYSEALELYEKLLGKTLTPIRRAEISYHAGASAAALEQFEKAAKLYNIAIKTDLSPWEAKAYLGQLQLLYDKKEYQKVITLLSDSSIRLVPQQRARQGFIVGKSYLQLDKPAESIAFFDEVERALPNSDAAFSAGYQKLKAIYQINSKKTPEQVDQFLQGYAVGRGTHKYIHQALLMKAEVLYQNKSYKLASQTYSAINPEYLAPANRASMLYKKAWSLSHSENHEGAINAFTQFMNEEPKDPKVPTAYTMRGQSHMKLGDRVKALKDLDKAILLAPKSKVAARALQLSARVERDAKRYPDAVTRFEQLLSLPAELTSQPSKANSEYWLGHCLYKLDKIDQAISHLEAARQSSMEDYGKQSTLLLMMIQYNKRNFIALKNEVAELEKLKLHDQVPRAVYRWMGGEAYKQGDFEAATDYLSKGTETGAPQKTSTSVWRLLTKSQIKTKKWNQVLESSTILTEVETEPAYLADALSSKALAQFKLNDSNSALATAEKALAMRPSGATKGSLLKLVGDIAYSNKDFEKASQHFVVVVESFQSSSNHADALYMLIQSLNQLNKDSSSYQKSLSLRYPDYRPPAGF